MLSFRSRFLRVGGFSGGFAPAEDIRRAVEIQFEIQYTECDLANKLVEKKPILKVFLGSDFERSVKDGEANISLDEDDLSKTYTATLKGNIKDLDSLDDALIGISHYAQHRNEQHVAGYQDCGMSHMILGDLLSGNYDQEHELIMRTVTSVSRPLKKGAVRVRVKNIKVPPRKTSSNQRRRKRIDDPIEVHSLSSYIEMCHNLDTSIPDTLPGTERIRAPMDISPLGIETTKNCFLPIAAYDMFELPVTNQAFWENSVKICLERKNLIPENYHDMDITEKNRLYGKMISMTVQVMNYFSDVAYLGNRNDSFTRNHLESIGIELMGTNTNAADCEDDASMMMLLHKAFQRMDFSQAEGIMGEILRELQLKIARDLVAALLLAVVHGAKVGDATESYGAHMYCGFFTKDMIERALSKSPQGRALLNKTKEPQVMLLPDAEKVDRGIGYASSDDVHPIPMFLEGTGIIDPIGYEFKLIDEMRYLAMNFPETNTGKMEIPYKGHGEPSSFYVENLLAVTSHFSDYYGTPIGSLIIGTSARGKTTRGHAFTDFMTDKDNMVLIPHPPMPENVIRTVKEAIKLQPPPHEYIYDAKRFEKVDTKHPDLERFKKALEKQGRELSNPKKGSIDKYFQPQNLSKKLIDTWIDRIPDLQRLCKIDYQREQYTNTAYCYRVQFFIE